MTPATTAAPIVPPETPLSEELDVVAGCALLVPVPDAVLCVAVDAEDPKTVLLEDTDAFTIASLLRSEKSKTLPLVQFVPYEPQLFCVAHAKW
jgi:hypothetical protein